MRPFTISLAQCAGLIVCALMSSPILAAAQDSTELKPPPREKGKPRKLAPRWPPQNWVTPDDYPDAAMVEHQEGTVAFALNVGPDGHPLGCTITKSSGFTLLDETACGLLRRRARFHPALDEKGVPVAASFTSRFTWTLPDQKVPWSSWARVYRYTLSRNQPVGCEALDFGVPAELKDDSCVGGLPDAPPGMVDAILGKADSVTLTIVERYEASGQAFPADIPALSGTVVRRNRITYSVDPDGKVRDCRIVEGRGGGLFSAFYRCHPGFRFPEAAQGVQRSGSVTTVMTTTGEVPAFMTADGASPAKPLP